MVCIIGHLLVLFNLLELTNNISKAIANFNWVNISICSSLITCTSTTHHWSWSCSRSFWWTHWWSWLRWSLHASSHWWTSHWWTLASHWWSSKLLWLSWWWTLIPSRSAWISHHWRCLSGHWWALWWSLCSRLLHRRLSSLQRWGSVYHWRWSNRCLTSLVWSRSIYFSLHRTWELILNWLLVLYLSRIKSTWLWSINLRRWALVIKTSTWGWNWSWHSWSLNWKRSCFSWTCSWLNLTWSLLNTTWLRSQWFVLNWSWLNILLRNLWLLHLLSHDRLCLLLWNLILILLTNNNFRCINLLCGIMISIIWMHAFIKSWSLSSWLKVTLWWSLVYLTLVHNLRLLSHLRWTSWSGILLWLVILLSWHSWSLSRVLLTHSILSLLLWSLTLWPLSLILLLV